MERLINELRNNRRVIFDSGSFDDWCVYVVESDNFKKAPYDVTYFSELKTLSLHYEIDKVYNDFVLIYLLTTNIIEQNVIQLISKISSTYKSQDQAIIEQWMSVIYGGMIAEENKAHAILKKRVKRLGMYQLLKLDLLPQIAANFSKGKKWRELDLIMTQYGF